MKAYDNSFEKSGNLRTHLLLWTNHIKNYEYNKFRKQKIKVMIINLAEKIK
jgi:hypothetical protein